MSALLGNNACTLNTSAASANLPTQLQKHRVEDEGV